MTTPNEVDQPPGLAGSLFWRVFLAGSGFGAYKLVQPYVRIDLQDQVAPSMFAMAGVVGVFAGFAATAVVFVAASYGPGIEQIRRNQGRRLTFALLSAVVVLLISAVGLVVCGVFGNGWGAKGAAAGLLLAPLYDLVVVLLAMYSAINSMASPKLKPQSDDEV